MGIFGSLFRRSNQRSSMLQSQSSLHKIMNLTKEEAGHQKERQVGVLR